MAGTSVLKLKVDDKEYNSSLKQAQQGMQHLEQALKGAGKSFTQVDKSVVDYVRGIGQMEAQSKTARGRISEMSNAFVAFSQQYKNMSDEVKSSDVGKALSESMEQLKRRTIEAKKELEGLNQEISITKVPDMKGGGGSLFSGLGDKMSGALQVFGGNLMTKATGAIANLGSEMYDMVQQGIELAKQGEGIRIAFERLNQPDLLDKLKEATHGTVSELELMKQAIKFENFKLPLEDLSAYLAFAQQKAKDTGESVGFLVTSIVNGLGRQSKQILDNLGISASELTRRMNEGATMTEAVAAIIKEEMAKAGDYIETAADRAAQANASLTDKMEELGRKFAPVEEASTQLWTSMKIAILDVVGGPLARLLNGLTEAGRLKNMLNDLNGGGNGKESRNEKALRILREYSGGGRGVEGKRDLYNRQVARYNELESNEWRQVNNLRKQREGFRKKAARRGARESDIYEYNRYDQQIAEHERKAKAWQIMRADYEAGAKQYLQPVNVNQTKADIKGLGGSVSTSTTHKATSQERAADKVSEAERTYSETLLKNSIRMEAGLDSTLDNKKKELSAQERLFDAYNDAYATYKDPAYKEASKQAAEKIKQLSEEVKTLTDTQEESKKAARELEAAQKKLADAQQKLADAQATGSATAVYKAQKDVNRQQEVVNRLQNPSLPVPSNPTGFEAYKQSVQAEIKFDQMQVDENTLHTLLQTALQNGLDGLTVDYSGLQERIAKGIDIPDSTWETLQEEINAKLKGLGIEPIKIDFKTGNVTSQAKEMTEDWKGAASAIQAVGSAMSQIEDPAAKVMGTVAQAIATIALTFSKSLEKTFTPWDWIAAAAAGTATMISTISAIHSATGYAEGGIVQGTQYSGDNVWAGNAWVNSGELILNRVQQGVLADALSEPPSSVQGGNPYVSGENIYLGMNNYLRRAGYGELVTTKR